MSINLSYLVSLRYSHLPLRLLYYVGWCSPNFVLSQNWIFPDNASQYNKYRTEKSLLSKYMIYQLAVASNIG